jgi:hypothetical protein
MAADTGTPDSGYINWPPVAKGTAQRLGSDGHADRHGPGRAMDRMRLTLRAYEQRDERRRALYAWIAARAVLSSRL